MWVLRTLADTIHCRVCIKEAMAQVYPAVLSESFLLHFSLGKLKLLANYQILTMSNTVLGEEFSKFKRSSAPSEEAEFIRLTCVM